MELKLGLLEKDVNQVNAFSERLLISIEKIQDVSTKLLQMLALHEQKLETTVSRTREVGIAFERRKSENAVEMKVLYDKISNLQIEFANRIKSIEDKFSEKMEKLLEELSLYKLDSRDELHSVSSVLQTWKWAIIGGAFVLGWITSHSDVIVKILSMF